MAAGSSAVWAAHHGCCRLHPQMTRRGSLLLLPLPSRRGGASLARTRASLASVAARTASEEAVYEVVLRQAALVEDGARRRQSPRWAEEDGAAAEGAGLLGWGLLGDAYDRCGEVCAEYAKTFYLGESPAEWAGH